MPRQLSLLEYARLREPARSDVEHVEQIAADVIRELDEGPPVNLDVVASYRGITRVELVPIPMAGCLAPGPREIVMLLNRGDSRRRRRFTGFHEVGHTFQPGYRTRRSYRCAPSAVPPRSTDPETLSDAAGAALLLPKDHFRPDVLSSDFGLRDVVALAARYDASVQATMYRFQRYWPEPTLTLVLEPGFRKSEVGRPDAEARLRVVSVHANGAWPFVPRNKSAEAGGALWRALHGELMDTTTNLDELGIGLNLAVDVSARSFKYSASGESRQRVLALFRPRSSRTIRQPAPRIMAG
jgi:hypothetical protein